LPVERPQPPDCPIFSLASAFLRIMRPDQLIGGIVYSANELVRPGVVRNNSPKKNAIEIAAIADASESAVACTRTMLEAADIESPPVADIRSSLWLKLVGNCSVSSLCVATGNPAAIVSDPAIQATFLRMMTDCLAVAAAHGYPVGDKLDLSRWTQHRSRHKPSMLQDYEAGRSMEIAEMVLAPVAFARAAGLQTPTLDAVAAITARLARDKGLFDAA
jgi:2-dehydropantoate 2-reductase